MEFGQRYLPGIFAAFREQYPQVRFYLQLGHPTELLAQLKDGQLDFSLADIFSQRWSLAQELSLFDITPIFREELILVCSREYHQEHMQEPLSLKMLESLCYVAYKLHAPSIKSWFAHHFETTALHLTLAMTVESVKAAIAGVQHHMGLALVPSHLVQQELQRGEIVALETSKPPIHNDICMVQLLDKVPTLTEKTFIQFCQENLVTVQP